MKTNFPPPWAALLARRLLSYGPNLLLVLPATDRAISLSIAFARLRECWILKTKAFDFLSANDAIRQYLHTPAEIVRLATGSPTLARPVISFPELIVGDGPSFVETRFLGKLRYFSTMEPLLVARHKPRIVSVKSFLGARAYRLHEIGLHNSHQPSPLLSILETLLQPVETEAYLEPGDWRAMHSLAAKTETGFAMSLREDCRDLEALLRTLLLRDTRSRQEVRGLLLKISNYLQSNGVPLTPKP